jgi:hypothetical protein
MFARAMGAVALVFYVYSSATSNALAAGHQPGFVHRVSCSVVRYYVAKYSASTAEMWARSHGATEAQIEAARRCLDDARAQDASSAGWDSQ